MDEFGFRIYVTDILKGLSGANVRYFDWIDRKPVDNRTGAEIAAEVMQKAGLKLKGGETI